MLENTDANLTDLATQFFSRNYDYLFLKAMLEKAKTTTIHGSTLITGSSHALNGIWEGAWSNAINCSMHSQDIYYDFQCAKSVLEAASGQAITRCFIVMGYYIAFQDLSLSKVSRETMISQVYYPIFHDAHNWEHPIAADPWVGSGVPPEPIKTYCERAAMAKILELGTYYNQVRQRGSYFNLKGRSWAEVLPEEREAMGRYRAAEHNKVFEHTASFLENRDILKDFVHFLYLHNVLPVVVITPFTEVYNRCILKAMKDAVVEMLDYVPEDVHFVDFNQVPEIFNDTDFMDTDHLNAQGAKKVSKILAEMFEA